MQKALMVTQLYKHCKTYFRFDIKELKNLLLVSLIFGFILSFGKWGGDTFDAGEGVAHFIFFSIVSFFIIFFHISTQKIFAIKDGYKLTYVWWYPGVIIGFMLTFILTPISSLLHTTIAIIPASIPFLYPGMLKLDLIHNLRLGKHRQSFKFSEITIISISGIITNVLLALLFGIFYLKTHNPLMLSFMKVNLLFAFFSMLPLPTFFVSNIRNRMKLGEGATAGFNIFFFSRPLYIFIFVSLIIYSALIYIFSAIIGSFVLLIIALVLGLISIHFFLKLIGESL